MRGRLLTLALLAIALPAIAEPGDAGRGETVYERCEGCHSPDANRVGPRHRGVVGRIAGSLADYNYSRGLKGAGFVWTDELLDKWLTNPQSLVPGAKMGFRLGDPQERADVIAYLNTLR